MTGKPDFNARCSYLLQNFQEALDQRWNPQRADKENIEECFVLCSEYWEMLRLLISGHAYDNREDEIYFFRHIKPAFTSEIEYYSLRCQAQIFKPGTGERLLPFWVKEERRMKEFSETYSSFWNYYQSGHTDKDGRYFVRGATISGHFPSSKLYTEDTRCATGYDHLVACILAQKKYHGYAVQELTKAGQSP